MDATDVFSLMILAIEVVALILYFYHRRKF